MASKASHLLLISIVGFANGAYATDSRLEAAAPCADRSCANRPVGISTTLIQHVKDASTAIGPLSKLPKTVHVKALPEPTLNTNKEIDRQRVPWANAVGLVTATHRCTEEIDYQHGHDESLARAGDSNSCRREDGSLITNMSVTNIATGTMISRCHMVTAKHPILDNANVIGRRIDSFEVGVPDNLNSGQDFKYKVSGTIVANGLHDRSMDKNASYAQQELVIVKLDKVREGSKSFHVGDKVGYIEPLFTEDKDLLNGIKVCAKLGIAGYPGKRLQDRDPKDKSTIHPSYQEARLAGGSAVQLLQLGISESGQSGGPVVCMIKDSDVIKEARVNDPNHLHPHILGIVIGNKLGKNNKPYATWVSNFQHNETVISDVEQNPLTQCD